MRLVIAAIIAVMSMSGFAQLDESETIDPAVRQQIDLLAEKALTEAVKVVAESGGFYPFGLVLDRDESVRLVGATEPPGEGRNKQDMAVTLFWQIRALLDANAGFIAAAVVKEHAGFVLDGQSVPGIWVTVDHRSGPAWVIFLPFIPTEGGTYRLSEEPIYMPASEPLFLPGTVTEAEE